jgi:hypothetical protein
MTDPPPVAYVTVARFPGDPSAYVIPDRMFGETKLPGWIWAENWSHSRVRVNLTWAYLIERVGVYQWWIDERVSKKATA